MIKKGEGQFSWRWCRRSIMVSGAFSGTPDTEWGNVCGETSDGIGGGGRGRKGGQKGDGLIVSRRIWKWLESKKRTQEREVPGEQQSTPATPLRVGIKPGGERDRAFNFVCQWEARTQTQNEANALRPVRFELAPPSQKCIHKKQKTNVGQINEKLQKEENQLTNRQDKGQRSKEAIKV